MPHPHLISFVIPAWNEESVLGPTLAAVSVATRHLAEASEVIVADDSSTDRTAEIARQHGARVVTVQHRQISATRNAGARAAQGDLLIFIQIYRITFARQRYIRDRRAMGVWYGERRPDPELKKP